MRNVTALGIVSFFTDFSTEMVLGVLPYFIIGTLGASRALLGTIEGSAELVSYAFRMVSGAMSDKAGRRKPIVFAGYAASAASKPFFAASAGWLDAFIVRTADRAGKGIRTAPRDALIADSVSASRMGTAFGLHRTMDQIGAVAGPVVAFALLQFIDVRGVFLASIIPGVAALAVLALFVKEVRGKRQKTTMAGNIRSLARGNRPLLILLAISGAFSLGAFNFSFVLVRASDMGVQAGMLPLVYAAINVAHAAVGVPAGAFSDKIGKEKTLVIGYSVFAASSVLMAALSPSPLNAYVLAAVYGLYAGISETVQRAVIPRYVSQELRATAFGLYSLVVGACLFAGNVVFGFLWDSYGLAAAATYSSAVAGISIALMLAFIARMARPAAH